MQMIDVMKRLAELDSKNPTIVKENQQVEECGIMPEMGMGMEKPAMPASINMTAGSGEELSDMLATIMQLAGVKQHGAEEPMSDEPMVALTAEPEMGGGDAMRSMMDKLNPEDDVRAAHGDIDGDGDHDMDDHEAEKDEEEADEGQYDNSPADPRKPPPFGANDFARQENQPGQGDRMDGNMPKATMEQQLMADYKEFVAEAESKKKVSEISTALVNKVHNARELNRDIASNANSDEHSARIQAKADSMGKSKWDRSVTAKPGPLAAAADAAQQKFDRNKRLTVKRPNSNYGRDQAELGAWGQRVGQSQGSGQSVWRK